MTAFEACKQEEGRGATTAGEGEKKKTKTLSPVGDAEDMQGPEDAFRKFLCRKLLLEEDDDKVHGFSGDTSSVTEERILL